MVHHMVQLSHRIRYLWCRVTLVHHIQQPPELKGFDFSLGQDVSLYRTTTVEPGRLIRVLQVQMIKVLCASCCVMRLMS